MRVFTPWELACTRNQGSPLSPPWRANQLLNQRTTARPALRSYSLWVAIESLCWVSHLMAAMGEPSGGVTAQFLMSTREHAVALRRSTSVRKSMGRRPLPLERWPLDLAGTGLVEHFAGWRVALRQKQMSKSMFPQCRKEGGGQRVTRRERVGWEGHEKGE